MLSLSRAQTLSSAAFSLAVTRILGFATGGSGPSLVVTAALSFTFRTVRALAPLLVNSTGVRSFAVGEESDCADVGLARFFIW